MGGRGRLLLGQVHPGRDTMEGTMYSTLGGVLSRHSRRLIGSRPPLNSQPRAGGV